jgi:hypothetical protein
VFDKRVVCDKKKSRAMVEAISVFKAPLLIVEIVVIVYK